MARLQLRKPWPTPPPNPEQSQEASEAKLDGGMNTGVDPADLPLNQLTVARNCYVIQDHTRRVPGTKSYAIAAPNSDPILLVYSFVRFDEVVMLYRFTQNKIYRNAATSWVEVTSPTPFSLTNTDRIRVLSFNNRLFFTTDKERIYEINVLGDTYAPLGTSGKYKYITGFFNRVVAANFYSDTNPNPTLVAWSGDINFGVWDPLVDISAGSLPLLEGATDYSDPITGLFGFPSVMLVLRESSLWTASKRPVASNPFQFQAAFPTYGCDCPNTAAQKQNGLIWYNHRANQVYNYTFGSAPVPVGDPVKNEIKSKVTNLQHILGAYDQTNNSYTLFLPGTPATAYILNLDKGVWTERTITGCNGIFYSDAGYTKRSINQLTGTINSLTGTIDNLSNSTLNPPTTLYGMNDGRILETDITSNTDAGQTITTTLESKLFFNPSRKLCIARLRFTYKVFRAGSFLIEYWNGNAWASYKTVTMTGGQVDQRLTISCVKHILAREYKWRITSSTGDFSILHHSIDYTLPDGSR